MTVEFLSGGGETSKDVVRPEKMVNNHNLSRQWETLGQLTGREMDGDARGNWGVCGSCFGEGLNAGGVGAGSCCLNGCRAGCLAGCFDGALTGALPRALELELKSRTSWLPAFITGLGVEGMGGLVKYPPVLTVLLLN